MLTIFLDIRDYTPAFNIIIIIISFIVNLIENTEN